MIRLHLIAPGSRDLIVFLHNHCMNYTIPGLRFVAVRLLLAGRGNDTLLRTLKTRS